MKLGLVSAVLEEMSFEQMIDYASKVGLECLEVACWPNGDDKRRYAGVTHIDVVNMDTNKANYIKKLCRDKRVEISALAYYPNLLDDDEEKAILAQNHLIKVIEAAKMLDVGIVTTFIGRNHKLSIEDNLKLIKDVWDPILFVANKLGIKIAIENCPMLFSNDEWPGGKNIMISPKIWKQVFDILNSDCIGLNFDPSHFVWQQLDYIKAIYDFKDKIFFIHFKDIKIYYDKLSQCGILATPLEYIAPKLIGYGNVKWNEFVSALTDIKYNGYTSIEIEDKAFEDNLDMIKQAIEHSIKYIRNYV